MSSFKQSSLYRLECLRRYLRIIALNSLLPAAHAARDGQTLKIGLIKRGGIGDWILFAAALRQLRLALAGRRLEVVVYTESRQADAAQLLGLLDRVEVADMQRLRKSTRMRYAFLRAIRAEAFDVWMDSDISRTNIGDAAALASQAPLRVAYAADAQSPCHALIEHRAFTHVLPDNTGRVHMRDRFLMLTEAVCTALGVPCPPLETDIPATGTGLQRFAWGGSGAADFLIAPGASSPIRTWPAERFAEVVSHVVRTYGLNPVLIGGASDREACDAVAQKLDGLRCENRCGLDGLEQSFARLSQARLLLTNDSGPMHMGQVIGLPTVAVVSGADFTSYSDYPVPGPHFRVAVTVDQHCFNCRWHCPYPNAGPQSPKACLNAVAADQVIHQVDQVMAASTVQH